MNKKLLLIAALTAGISCSLGAFAACSDNTGTEGGAPGGNQQGGTTLPEPEGTYTVTFQTNGGTPVQPVEVDAGSSIDLDSCVTTNSDGSYFYGWYTDAELTQRALTEFVPGGDVTLYAAWGTDAVYTITYDSCGGSAVPAEEYAYYEYLVEPQSPTREGYVFMGWYWDADYAKQFIFVGNTMVDGDITVYAKWAELYTLTFDTDGGSAVPAVTGVADTKVSAPADPVKEGYVFDGWFADEECTRPFEFSALTADVTAYAKWHAVSQNISITLNLNSPLPEPETQSVVITGTEGQPFADDEAVENFSDAIQAAFMGGDAEGPVYIFGGWAYDAAGAEPVGEVVPHSDGPLQLYAVWLRSANYAMLTFKSNGEGLLVFVPKTGLISADDLAAIRQLFGADSDVYVTADGVTIDISSTPIETDMVLTPAADSGFEFEKLGSGYALTAYSGTQTALEVPAVHEGAPVVAIAEGAFEGNVGIVSVTLPSCVTQIGARAFAGCSSLASVTGGRLRSVASDAFEGTAVGYESQGVIYLNDSLKTVLGCSASASKVNLPASVSAIADGAFAGSNITSFSLAADSALYALPEGAFEGCASLESADLSSAEFATVGGSAFRGCTALTKISLPSSVSSVGAYAFYGCAEVDAISLAGVRTLGEYALAGTAIEDVEWTDMRLTALAEGVFAGCASLKSVVLPTGLRSIGKDAFAGCASLETVNINAPDGGRIQSIGEGAFEGCASLERVILFAGLNDDAPAAIAEGAFEGCGEGLVIFVADGSPVYNTGSAWYDPSADGMTSYVAIYSQSYPSLTFMASDLSSPVITCGSSSIMVSANDVTANTDVAALLAANGVSATDNYTPADRIVLSIDELVRISTYEENSEEEGEAVEPDEDGLYDLTGKGVYRVTVRATDLFGNYAYTVVTLAVVL